MAYNTDTRSAGITFGQRLSEIRADLADRFARRRVYRTTMSELQMLNDRELNDLGINRSDIKRISLESAYK